MKLNCWEFKRCGRQAEGAMQETEGLCPTSGEIRLDGLHDGVSSGRACWVVAGTYSKGSAVCSSLKDISDCKDCDFYQRVLDEEGAGFLSMEDLREALGC